MISHAICACRFRAPLVAVLVLVSAGDAAAAACPALKDGQRLRMNIFNGDPARGADLAPATRGTRAGYHNTWDFPGGARGVVLVCSVRLGRHRHGLAARRHEVMLLQRRRGVRARVVPMVRMGRGRPGHI